MAKIAVELQQALARRAARGGPGHPAARLLARGDGWVVEDVLCTCGPEDRSFEEQHSTVSVAVVVAGTFQYSADSQRSTRSELMTPGSVLLGNPGQYFECEHTHGAGDRCISFRYAPEHFANLAADVGIRDALSPFALLRLPPVRALSPIVGLTCAALAGSTTPSWEELSIQVAAQALKLANGLSPRPGTVTPDALDRVTRIVRTIERHPDGTLTLDTLARTAELSPYHFLRTFERVTGVTPHQYVLRARLREAATRLAADRSKIVDVALDSGFGDVSNFNRAFRAEFGASPRAFRTEAGPS